MEQIKILLVDDHQVVRKGLKLLFSGIEEFNIVGGCDSAEEALEFLSKNNVDVIVSDVTMPGIGGLSLVKKVSELYPDIEIMILSMHMDEDYIIEAIDAGAKSYLVKDSSESDIINAVKSISKGELYLTRTVSDILAKSLISKKKTESVQKNINLTKRESEILHCIVDGLSNKMIGAQLFISEKTVNAHRYNIMKKLDAKNSADLVRITLSNNLIS